VGRLDARPTVSLACGPHWVQRSGDFRVATVRPVDVILGAAITLAGILVSALVTRAGARADGRVKAKAEAGEQLAEYVRFVWDKGENHSWLNLQTYLSRLRGPLHRAGVPSDLYKGFRAKAIAMWNSLEYHPDLEDVGGWMARPGTVEAAQEAADTIYEALEARPPWWRRALT
jgi:hypothetical protein